MKKLQLSIMAAVSVLAVQAYATALSPAIIGPGNSWDLTWNDGNYSGAYDTVVYDITAGGATFDAAATVTGETGSSWTSTSSTVDVPNVGANTTMVLSFNDPAPAGGVQVSVLYYLNGNLLTGSGFNWEWLNLPVNTGITQGADWQYLPNPSVPDGGMTVTLLGGALMGLVALRRKLFC